MNRFSVLGAVAFCWCVSVYAQTAGYSKEPLQKPVFEPARLLVESVSVNNWLNANSKTLSPQQVKGVREHVHALIDSRVKEIYARDGAILPKEPDPVLAMLFSWVGRLGVYGADQTYAKTRGTFRIEPPPGPLVPEGFIVSLNGDALRVGSLVGKWELTVPYYFFIFDLRNLPEPDGQRTQAVAISTGSASDASAPGYSQATLAVLFSSSVELERFTATWAPRFGIPASLPLEPVEGTIFRSRKTYDAALRLHREVVYLGNSNGSLAVLYAGLDGTYQWNRAHFVDFLSNLKLEP